MRAANPDVPIDWQSPVAEAYRRSATCIGCEGLGVVREEVELAEALAAVQPKRHRMTPNVSEFHEKLLRGRR